jgi:hypothetical protein
MLKKCKKGILFLCLALVITTICTTPVSAAVPKNAYSVTFNGKTKTLIKLSDVKKDSYNGAVAPDTLTKAWGKYTKKSKDGITDYVFKKGKSSVLIGCVEGNSWWSTEVNIKDKNMAFCGVKVGQTKAKAVKTLTGVFGKSAVKSTGKLITLEFDDDSNYPGYLEITIKSGKVKKIFFFAS